MDPLAPVRLTTAYFILFCITLHLYTAWSLLFFPESAGSTTVSTAVAFFEGTEWASVAYLVAAFCATFGLKTRYPVNVLLLLPQQAMLLMAAVGVFEAVWTGHFADGVVRPRMFILQDHIELPLITGFHAGVLIMRAALTSRLGPGLFYHPLERVGL